MQVGSVATPSATLTEIGLGQESHSEGKAAKKAAEAAAYEAANFMLEFEGEYLMPLSVQKVERLLADSDVPVLLVMGAEWCAPCKLLAPRLQEIGKTLKCAPPAQWGHWCLFFA